MGQDVLSGSSKHAGEGTGCRPLPTSPRARALEEGGHGHGKGTPGVLFTGTRPRPATEVSPLFPPQSNQVSTSGFPSRHLSVLPVPKQGVYQYQSSLYSSGTLRIPVVSDLPPSSPVPSLRKDPINHRHRLGCILFNLNRYLMLSRPVSLVVRRPRLSRKLIGTLQVRREDPGPTHRKHGLKGERRINDSQQIKTNRTKGQAYPILSRV